MVIAGGPGIGKPHPSLLTLRHPFAGHALGLADLVGGHARDKAPWI
jgi:hypothetical protein